MKKDHTVIAYTCLIAFFSLIILTSTTIAHNFPEGKEDLYIQNNILFYEPGVETRTFDQGSISPTSHFTFPCGETSISVDPSSTQLTESQNSVWLATKYNATDEELKGIIRVALHENSRGLAFEISLMANLYDSASKTTFPSIAEYVKNSTWFSSETRKYFNQTGDNVTKVNENLELARSIIVAGNRRTPPEINEHDCIYCGTNSSKGGWCKNYNASSNGCGGKKIYKRYDIAKIQQPDGKVYHIARYKGDGHDDKWPGEVLDGVSQADIDYVNDRKNYVKGQTIITNTYGSVYVFYDFPAYDSNGNPLDQDPFGYKLKGNTTISEPIPCDSITYVNPDELSSIKTLKERFAYLFGNTYTMINDMDLNIPGDKENATVDSSFLTSVPIKIRGGTKTTNLYTHKKLAGALQSIFDIIATQTNFQIDETVYSHRKGRMYKYDHPTNHAYGTAVDINTYDNPYYSDGCTDYAGKTGYELKKKICYYSPENLSNPAAVTQEIVDIFGAYGFKWLGSSTPSDKNPNKHRFDPMHFSYTFH